MRLPPNGYVVEKLARPIIVGAATMQKWDIRLLLKAEGIRVGIDPQHIELA